MVQEELHRVTYNENDNKLNLRIGDRLSQSDTDSFLALLLYEGLQSGLRNSEHIIITRKEYEDNYGDSVNNLLSAAAKLIDYVGYIYEDEYNVIDTYTVWKDKIVITSDFLHQLLLHIVTNIVPIVTAYSYLSQIFREIIWQEQKNIPFLN